MSAEEVGGGGFYKQDEEAGKRFLAGNSKAIGKEPLTQQG
jgi:hypothetical protein